MIVLVCSAAVDIVRRVPQGMALRGMMLSDEKIISTSPLFAEIDSAF